MNFINKAIYDWYDKNRRDLPWRNVNDPYLVWISEVILQQTRISQGLPYYVRFVSQFPDIQTLAEAPEDLLMKTWEGLGYYSRARNLHAAAKILMNRNDGVFPGSFKAIRSLPGIGEYTASAVASIAFGLPYPAVDGNVVRFLSRYFGITEPVDKTSGTRIIKELATRLFNEDEPGYHNQAFMEFGALCCIPSNPGCISCPLHLSCVADNRNMAGILPVKRKKKSKIRRYFYFYLFEDGNRIIIQKREQNDIWKNLYQFPMIESNDELSDADMITAFAGLKLTGMIPPLLKGISNCYKHELTHQQILARFIRISSDIPQEMNGPHIVINKKEICKFAFPALISNFLTENGIMDKVTQNPKSM